MVGRTIQKILDHTKNIEVQNTTSAGANYEYQPTVNNIRCSRYRLRRFYGFEILCYSLLFIQQVVFSLWSEHRASTCDVMFITKSYLQETHIIVAFIDDSSLKCCSFSTNKQSILECFSCFFYRHRVCLLTCNHLTQVSIQNRNGLHVITLFTSITMFCGTDNILQNIPHIQTQCTKYSAKYCSSHITLLWIWIMLWLVFDVK